MENKNENMSNKLPDQQLQDVAGGYRTSGILSVVTDNFDKYSSGDTPKYAVGQHLVIMAGPYGTAHMRIPCEVLSVSETKTGGYFYKEFVYSVVILPFSLPLMKEYEAFVGKVYDDVYESCLYVR